jgi:hypothetical protein
MQNVHIFVEMSGSRHLFLFKTKKGRKKFERRKEYGFRHQEDAGAGDVRR